MKKILEISEPIKNETLLSYLTRLGYTVSADCAGLGTCGKCKVKVIKGEFINKDTNKPYLPDEQGYILSCKAICPKGNGIAELADNICTDNTFNLQNKSTGILSKNLGVALDIGTTTLCAALVDLDTKSVLNKISALNPQKNFGADVISRITAAKLSLNLLQSVLISAIERMILDLTQNLSNTKIQKMTVTGNPTMLHLFCGISPEKMGTYPFTPEFLELKEINGKTLNLPIEKIYVLPSASAFIGSDITSAVLYLNLTQLKNPCLLLDIGTNGEMVLFTGTKNGSKLFAASAAAGPAMEGVGISCGVGGINGAISKVENTNSGINYTTVGDLKPTGICTSGLIDLTAILLETKMLDETGCLECEQFNLYKDSNTTIFINQDDIRALQLAKSAVRAALDALLFDNGFDYSNIDTIYLAGGIGYYLNPITAAKIGLFPNSVVSKVKAMGNSSLLGAVNCLTNPDEITALSELCKNITTMQLTDSKTFNDAFIEHMFF